MLSSELRNFSCLNQTFTPSDLLLKLSWQQSQWILLPGIHAHFTTRQSFDSLILFGEIRVDWCSRNFTTNARGSKSNTWNTYCYQSKKSGFLLPEQRMFIRFCRGQDAYQNIIKGNLIIHLWIYSSYKLCVCDICRHPGVESRKL